MVQINFHEATNVVNYIMDHGKEEHYAPRQFIYQAEDPADYIYVIKSGIVLINRMVEDGKEMSMKMLTRRSIFGSTTLFCGPKKHSLFAKVKTPTSVSKLNLKTFETALLEDEVLNYEWLLWLQNENDKNEFKMRDLFTLGKKGALYSTLIRLSNTYGVKTDDGILLNVELTNNDLANLCGTTREGVNRIISQLKTDKMISVKGKYIVLKNIQYLKNEINCESCPINICRIE
ncbi:Crp/Fnr family transcriptional regulator [Macrococcus hajekii]|uniref:HTH-type transcriptional regulator ArcR n=2 Tax=Macrococcus hajekii TaxID=198482 RepID=A0A4R6BP71_9STAP|nr:Crp/Fnr family transcriptional regulator [Macrococcus hajekii]TDM03588.1 Crp/Fnr family transcriptional regulator [Macrococcus hajekii]